MVHPAASARAATPAMNGGHANRQASSAFTKAQSARVLSTGTPNYHCPAVHQPQVITRSSQMPQQMQQMSMPQLPQAHQQGYHMAAEAYHMAAEAYHMAAEMQTVPPPPPAPVRSASIDNKFGAQ